MNLPLYRRTRGPFVTLYRSLDGAETELAHAFGDTAHSTLDAVQQEDLLGIAESADGGMKEAMKEPEMKTPTAKSEPELLKPFSVKIDGVIRGAVMDNGKKRVLPLEYSDDDLHPTEKPLPYDWPHVSNRSY